MSSTRDIKRDNVLNKIKNRHGNFNNFLNNVKKRIDNNHKVIEKNQKDFNEKDKEIKSSLDKTSRDLDALLKEAFEKGYKDAELDVMDEGFFQKVIGKLKKIDKTPPKKEVKDKEDVAVNVNKPVIIKQANLKEAYNNSYYTIEGAGGDLQEWVNWFNNQLAKEKIGRPVAWYTAKGRQVNKEFGLKGEWAYRPDFTFLFFPLDGLNLQKLSLFKLRYRNRWFDDIINNSIDSMKDK